MDAGTERLLRELEGSPTDLKRLVVSTIWRKRSAIAIESEAIARWERDDPKCWASVQEWLLSQSIAITVLKTRPTPSPYSSPQPPPPHEPPAAGSPG